MNEEDLEIVREVKRALGGRLLANPDVHAAGVGRRRRSGEKIDEYAIVLHLARKLPRDRVPRSRLLPTHVRYTTRDGRDVRVRVDVQEHAPPIPEGPDLSARVRPVAGGYSAGTGTLGGWVWDTLTDQIVALSNEHVFGSASGAPVTQPSLRDGGTPPEDQIARVLRAGTLDAAIAAPVAPAVVSVGLVRKVVVTHTTVVTAARTTTCGSTEEPPTSPRRATRAPSTWRQATRRPVSSACTGAARPTTARAITSRPSSPICA